MAKPTENITEKIQRLAQARGGSVSSAPQRVNTPKAPTEQKQPTSPVNATVEPHTAPEKTLENLKTGKESKKDEKPKGKHGGARPGSGREEGGTALAKRILKQKLMDFYTEEVEVSYKQKDGKIIKIKKPRTMVIIEALYQIAIESKDSMAMDRFLNRALGKAAQPIVGDEDEDAVQIDLGTSRMLDKVFGDNAPQDDGINDDD